MEATETHPISPSVFRLPSMMKERQTSFESDTITYIKKTRLSEDFENIEIDSSGQPGTKFENLSKEQIDGKVIKSLGNGSH